MSALRVVHVLHSLVAAGKERVALELATCGRARGDDHRILLFDVDGVRSKGDLDPGSVPVLGLPRGNDSLLKYSRRLRQTLAGLDPDAVHAHNDSALVYASCAMHGWRGPRLVATYHNLPSHVTRIGRWLARRSARRADAVACVSTELESELRHRRWIERAQVVRNGVDVGRFHPQAQPLGLRAALAVPPQGLLVGCVARLSVEKRHADLIEAARRARSQGVYVELVFVGEGPLRSALEAQIAPGERVHFIPFERNVAGLLVELDVFALVSAHEGLPMSLLEAMACGRAVLATGVGGIPELVEGGERSGGVLVPPGDVAGMASSLVRMADPELRRALGERARARVCSAHDLAAVAARYRELYSGEDGAEYF